MKISKETFLRNMDDGYGAIERGDDDETQVLSTREDDDTPTNRRFLEYL